MLDKKLERLFLYEKKKFNCFDDINNNYFIRHFFSR